MGQLFNCKFCKETIVDGNYIDERHSPIFDDIYHRDCYPLRTKEDEGKA